MLGEFVLPKGGSVWTSTVVRALAGLGVEERNARQAAFRLAERGYVQSEKEGRRARLHLTGSGRRLLTEGSRRIYEFGAHDDTWDRRWVVVVCFIPEEQRTKRHQLRSQLGFAGFGFIAPGVAVSPHLRSEPAANSILEDLDLVPGAVVLRAETGDLVEPKEILSRGWDLDGLASEYEEFIKVFARQDAAYRPGPLRRRGRARPRLEALSVYRSRDSGAVAAVEVAWKAGQDPVR